MLGVLNQKFDLATYLHSDNAERYGYKEQFQPSESVIDNLENLHEKIIIKLLQSKELTGTFICSSAYRCERLNKAIKGSSSSQHVKGEAIDLKYIENGKIENMKLYNEIISTIQNYDQLIKEFGQDTNPAWIHISLKKEGNNRKQILRIK